MIGNNIGQPIGGFTQIFESASAQFAEAGVAVVTGVGEATYAADAVAAGVAASDYRFEIVASAAGTTSASNMFGSGVIVPQGAMVAEGVATALAVSAAQNITETINFIQKPVDYVLAEQARRTKAGRSGDMTKNLMRHIFRE